MAITFSGNTKGAWVLHPNGSIIRVVVGGPVNSEICELVGSGEHARVVVTPTAAARGYRLMEEVFATTYAGKRTKDGEDLGAALFKIFRNAQDQGQAGVFPDDKLPAEVLERRQKWAAKRSKDAPKSAELEALLAIAGGGK